MRTVLRSVLVSLLLGVVATTAQLPPEIMLDGHLLRAEDAVRQRDPAAARAAMNQIEALQEQHELDAPATYHYRYASVWNALGAWDQSLASAVRLPQPRVEAGYGRSHLPAGDAGAVGVSERTSSPAGLTPENAAPWVKAWGEAPPKPGGVRVMGSDP